MLYIDVSYVSFTSISPHLKMVIIWKLTYTFVVLEKVHCCLEVH